MRPSESAAALRRFLAGRGIDIGTATLAQIVDAALDFYASATTAGLADTGDADMMLFQFGVYEWGEGEQFSFDLTRQFVIAGAEDDGAMSQLHCTAYYEPTATLRSIGRGNRWCHSQSELPGFKAAVLASEAFQVAGSLTIRRRVIDWEPV